MVTPAIKTAIEIIGGYGESGGGVHCPYCFSRDYPQTDNIATCLTCGNPYLIPTGYMPRQRLHKRAYEEE